MAKNKKASNDVIGLDVQLSKSEAFIEKHLKLILAILAVVGVTDKMNLSGMFAENSVIPTALGIVVFVATMIAVYCVASGKKNEK